MQFVWTYWNGGAKEDELRWSIRSTLYHFPSARITVVGDPPDWYIGHKVFRNKIPETQDHNANDVISKIEQISYHLEIEHEFTLMADDIYFLNSCSVEDLRISRAMMQPTSFANMKHKKWKRLKLNTFEALFAKGHPTFDFATHLPQVYEKQKLRKIFSEFNVRFPLLWEVLYGNVFRETPIDCFPFLHQQSSPVSSQNAEEASKKSIVLNHGNKQGWNSDFRHWLSERYPEKSKVEV